MFSLRYYKMVQSYTKTDSWFQISHDQFGQLQTSSGKSEKLKIGLLLSKQYMLSAKTLYREGLSNITCNYLCENLQITYVIFETINHFSRHTPLYFLAQTLHTFYKSSPSKCKLSDFTLLALKFTKFLMSFYKQKVSFSSKFGYFFGVMRDSSSVLF